MIIWDKFKKLWKYYIFQSSLAGIALFIIVLILEEKNVVMIASMGATAFLCFALPKSVSANAIIVICGSPALLNKVFQNISHKVSALCQHDCAEYNSDRSA